MIRITLLEAAATPGTLQRPADAVIAALSSSAKGHAGVAPAAAFALMAPLLGWAARPNSERNRDRNRNQSQK